MQKVRRLPFVATGLVILANVFALHAAASPPNHANRLEATFTETNASITNRIADLGVFQLINTGTGMVEGFGDATVMVSVTQDRSVDLSQKPNPAIKENKAVLDYFRKPSKYIRTDGIVATTSKQIVVGYKNDVDKARAIYEWIVDNTFRDPKVKGCGIGDIG